LHHQAASCNRLGSPFTARLLNVLADGLKEDTAVGNAVLNWPHDPTADALALRLAGSLHALVLTGQSAELINVYPPAIDAGHDQLQDAVQYALTAHAEAILGFIQSPPQTNEVARSAALAGGFFTIAALTALPLAILEIGASAGLNLHWDSFGYKLGDLAIREADGRPWLAPAWEGPEPVTAEVIISERAGCDRAPIDVGSDDDVLRLRAYVWPDQPDRLTRLDQAIATARASPISIERADAADWVSSRLSARQKSVVTVLFHSIVWQYIAADGQQRLERTIEHAGRAATSDAPFAWLRMEPETSDAAALHLTLWPGGETLHLAEVDYHGRWVRWRIEPDIFSKPTT